MTDDCVRWWTITSYTYQHGTWLWWAPHTKYPSRFERGEGLYISIFLYLFRKCVVWTVILFSDYWSIRVRKQDTSTFIGWPRGNSPNPPPARHGQATPGSSVRNRTHAGHAERGYTRTIPSKKQQKSYAFVCNGRWRVDNHRCKLNVCCSYFYHLNMPCLFQQLE